MVSLKLSGMKELQRALLRKEEALIKGIDEEIGASITTINAEQIRRIPRDTGTAARSLRPAKVAPLNWTIVSAGPGSKYVPYLEFGTGALVSVPEELKEEAMQFKGKGIRQINMNARPFFFPPFFMERPKLIQRIKDLLSKK